MNPESLKRLLKRIVCLAAFFATLFFAVSLPVKVSSASDGGGTNQTTCDEGPYPILVHVQGLRNDHGTIKAKLYSENPDEFLVTGKKLDARRVPSNGHRTSLCLYAPAPGVYAIVVHHDENGNKKLDQNWIGLPTEGVGFSNNPRLFLAPPDHADVAFPLTDGLTTIDITVHY